MSERENVEQIYHLYVELSIDGGRPETINASSRTASMSYANAYRLAAQRETLIFPSGDGAIIVPTAKVILYRTWCTGTQEEQWTFMDEVIKAERAGCESKQPPTFWQRIKRLFTK
jgi:hypothetical protein